VIILVAFLGFLAVVVHTAAACILCLMRRMITTVRQRQDYVEKKRKMHQTKKTSKTSQAIFSSEVCKKKIPTFLPVVYHGKYNGCWATRTL
jgi:cytochrome c biogenesis protein ResB